MLRSLLPIFALATLLSPLGAASQATITVYPRGGLIAPDPYLYEQFRNLVDEEPTEWSTGSLGRAALVGVGMEVDFEKTGVQLRGEVLRSFEGWLLVSHSRIVPRQLFAAPYVSVAWLDARYTMTLTSVQVVLPTRVTLWGAQPYVSAGVGGKFYAFSEPELPNDAEAILPSDGFTWGGDVGGGLLIDLPGAFTADVQARDAITQYWGKTQHDILYSGALRWRVR